MESKFEDFDEFVNRVKEYIHIRIALFKIGAAEKGAKLASKIMAKFVIAIMIMMAMLFASFALAIWLSNITGRPSLGFLIMAGAYLILAVILISLKKRLRFTGIMNEFISQLFKEEDDDGIED
ncbi:MAG: hypothetical protein GC171_15170 [Terrimonas sp.]|nr:hypothetical protein [Terrimonas sp.]